MDIIKIKIGLFGDTNVGKTSIFNIINNNKYNNTNTTIGVDFIIKNFTINNTNIKLHIWDTAGQERYNSIIKPYYTVDIPIYIFDMNDINSFNNLTKWINNVNYYNKSFQILKYLIGNKSDLDCKVAYSDINELIIKNNFKYYINSNLIKNNINQILNNIVNDIYKSKFNLSKNKVDLHNTISFKNNKDNDNDKDYIDPCC